MCACVKKGGLPEFLAHCALCAKTYFEMLNKSSKIRSILYEDKLINVRNIYDMSPYIFLISDKAEEHLIYDI